MTPETFEHQLHLDIDVLRSRSISQVEILITRWGKLADD